MAGYTVVIGSGASAKTLDANVSFRHSFDVSSSGQKGDRVEFRIVAEGDVVLSSAALIAAEIEELAAECRSKIYPREVTTLLDGVEVEELSVGLSDAITGPLVTSFECSTQDEGGESHMRWSLTIWAELSGREGEENEATVGLKTSLLVRKVNGQVTRKVWRATAEGATADEAESAVRNYAPAEPKIIEEVETYNEEKRATGAWVWEPRKDEKGIVSVEEKVEITRMPPGYEEQTRIGNDDPGTLPPGPIFYQKPSSAPRCVISIKIRSLDPGVVPFSPHYQADGVSIIRMFDEETLGEARPAQDFLKSGIYELEYTEVYKTSNVSFDPPNHSDHAELVTIDPPSDGVISD